ncbi:hypothetical protein Tco_0867049 [Tanacetum coccineum]
MCNFLIEELSISPKVINGSIDKTESIGSKCLPQIGSRFRLRSATPNDVHKVVSVDAVKSDVQCLSFFEIMYGVSCSENSVPLVIYDTNNLSLKIALNHREKVFELLNFHHLIVEKESVYLLNIINNYQEYISSHLCLPTPLGPHKSMEKQIQPSFRT